MGGVSSRMAATGGIVAARRAGSMALSTVITRPTISDTVIVRGAKTRAEAGNGAPAAWNRNCKPRANPAPTTIPTMLATTATATASAKIE